MGGEAYWAAGLGRLLEEDGVEVSYPGGGVAADVSALTPSMKQACADPGCRFFLDGYPDVWLKKFLQAHSMEEKTENEEQHKLLLDMAIDTFLDGMDKESHDLRLRMRILHWWGGYHGKFPENVIVPFTAFEGNAVPFPIHRAMLPQGQGILTPRGRKVFVVGKAAKIAVCTSHVQPLLSAGFDIHMTSDVCRDVPRVHFHGLLKPADFSVLLSTMAAVIGTGEPKDNPTPFEGLAVGAPFLNPATDINNIVMTSQVEYLTKFRAPYVYSYELNNTAAMVAAAEKAVLSPIPSGGFVPEEHQKGKVKDAICKYLYN